MDEYERQAKAFLEKFNLTVSAIYLDYEPPIWDDNQECNHPRYRIRIKRIEAKRSFTFYFWDSIANAEKGKKPTPYSVLTTVSAESYIHEDFNDFCANFGYDIDSRKAYKMFERCQRFARRINLFFSVGELEELREIR